MILKTSSISVQCAASQCIERRTARQCLFREMDIAFTQVGKKANGVYHIFAKNTLMHCALLFNADFSCFAVN